MIKGKRWLGFWGMGTRWQICGWIIYQFLWGHIIIQSDGYFPFSDPSEKLIRTSPSITFLVEGEKWHKWHIFMPLGITFLVEWKIIRLLLWCDYPSSHSPILIVLKGTVSTVPSQVANDDVPRYYNIFCYNNCPIGKRSRPQTLHWTPLHPTTLASWHDNN